MSDTPRTDSENARFPMGGFTLDFCRGMERELTEARDALKFRRELYALQTGHLNNVRAQLSEEQRLHVKTLNERDRLAAVLQRIRDGYGGQAAAPDCCEDCEFLIPIDEALQSLTNQPK